MSISSVSYYLSFVDCIVIKKDLYYNQYKIQIQIWICLKTTINKYSTSLMMIYQLNQSHQLNQRRKITKLTILQPCKQLLKLHSNAKIIKQ